MVNKPIAFKSENPNVSQLLLLGYFKIICQFFPLVLKAQHIHFLILLLNIMLFFFYLLFKHNLTYFKPFCGGGPWATNFKFKITIVLPPKYFYSFSIAT